MEYSKKTVVVPVLEENKENQGDNDLQVGGNIIHEEMEIDREERRRPGRPRKSEFIYSQNDKIINMIKIALKLNNNGQIDTDGRIRNSTGQVIENSNIYALIKAAVTPGKLLGGQDQFIKILYDSNVTPSLIINETLKNMLINYRPERRVSPIRIKKISEKFHQVVPARVLENNKRIREEDSEDEEEIQNERRRKLPRWDFNGNE